MSDPLERIAAALDRLSPATATEAKTVAAARWDGRALIETELCALPLDLLTGIDDAKTQLTENTRRHARGHAAHDALLWGARGSGKSALAKASVVAVRDEGLALSLVEVAGDALASLPALFDRLRGWADPVIVFLDDLGFDDQGASARSMRSLLDGGAAARPGNVRLYVTSNRRHIVARDIAEQESAINVRDVVDDRLALADRFGLSLGFHVADQPTYLAMVSGYAARYALPFDAHDAVQWATQRGSRSGRVAWHYIVELAGRAGRALEPSSTGV